MLGLSTLRFLCSTSPTGSVPVASPFVTIFGFSYSFSITAITASLEYDQSLRAISAAIL